MDIKVSIDAMTSDEFREFAERMSKYFDLRSCDTEECINDRIKSKKSKKLNVLVEHGFAFRLLLESWLNPHPVYREILGMDDRVYKMWIEEKKESEKELKKLKRWMRLNFIPPTHLPALSPSLYLTLSQHKKTHTRAVRDFRASK